MLYIITMLPAHAPGYYGLILSNTVFVVSHCFTSRFLNGSWECPFPLQFLTLTSNARYSRKWPDVLSEASSADISASNLQTVNWPWDHGGVRHVITFHGISLVRGKTDIEAGYPSNWHKLTRALCSLAIKLVLYGLKISVTIPMFPAHIIPGLIPVNRL